MPWLKDLKIVEGVREDAIIATTLGSRFRFDCAYATRTGEAPTSAIVAAFTCLLASVSFRGYYCHQFTSRRLLTVHWFPVLLWALACRVGKPSDQRQIKRLATACSYLVEG